METNSKDFFVYLPAGQKKKYQDLNIREKVFYHLNKFPNFMILYKAVAMIMVWCGIWGFLENYVFPDNTFLRYSSVFVLGLLLLWLDDKSIDELTSTPPTHTSHIENYSEEK